MDSKISLYNRAKQFIYSPKLEDLHIFSKQYFNSTIIPYNSSNTEKDNYAAICIDFNKLNDLNNRYGHETVDKIIHYSLSLIKSVLPPDSICSRTGGDEFVFLINNAPIESIENIIHNIHSILKQHEKELLFSSVTAYGVHCSEKESLSEMVDEADLRITEQKNNFDKESSYSKWGILEKKLTQNLTSFFKSLRLYKQPITIDFLKQLYVHAISSSTDLLETTFLNSAPSSKKLKYSTSLSMEDLEKIYHLFSQANPSIEEIENIDSNTYKYVTENLIRDPITGNFTKDYFTQYLLNDCEQKFNVKYLSTAFVKLYNAIFSHNATDIEFKNMIEKFFSHIENGKTVFVQDSFSKEKGNYFISLGAGDYLLAVPSDVKVSNSIVNSYIDSQNIGPSSIENLLKLICSPSFKYMEKDNFEEVLNELADECRLLKNDYKMEILTEPIMKDALNRIIYDSAEYYIENIPHSNDIKQKSKFLNVLSKCMIDVSHSLNQEQKLNKDNNR